MRFGAAAIFLQLPRFFFSTLGLLYTRFPIEPNPYSAQFPRDPNPNHNILAVTSYADHVQDEDMVHYSTSFCTDVQAEEKE